VTPNCVTKWSRTQLGKLVVSQTWRILMRSGLERGNTLRHCTVPLDLTSASGYATVSILVKKFPALLGTRWFITIYTGASTCHCPDPVNSVYTLSSSLCQIPFNIVLPSTPTPLNWPHYFRFPRQNSAHVPLYHHACHMLSLSHSPLSDHPNNIILTVHTTKLPIGQSSPFFDYCLPLGHKFPTKPLLLDGVSLCMSQQFDTAANLFEDSIKVWNFLAKQETIRVSRKIPYR
jgi:hypothetical protein